MKTAGRLAALTILVALLAAAGAGIVFAWRFAAALVSSLDSKAATAAAIAGVAVLVAAWIVGRASRTAIRRRETMILKEEKTATYQLFLDCWQTAMGQDLPNPFPSSDLAEKRRILDRLLLLYGSAAVIQAHVDLREVERQQGTRDVHACALLGKALLAVRRDLGADASTDVARGLQRLLAPVRTDRNDAMFAAKFATDA
jgi:hypothetical protein